MNRRRVVSAVVTSRRHEIDPRAADSHSVEEANVRHGRNKAAAVVTA